MKDGKEGTQHQHLPCVLIHWWAHMHAHTHAHEKCIHVSLFPFSKFPAGGHFLVRREDKNKS